MEQSMKKLTTIIFVSYTVFVIVLSYFFFGPGVFGGYEELHWQGVATEIPTGFNVRQYQSKGWQVYSLKKWHTLIKIAIRPAQPLETLLQSSRRLTFSLQPDPGTIYYIANPRRSYELVYAHNITAGNQAMTVFFSVNCPSVYSGSRIIKKMTQSAFFNGAAIPTPPVKLPMRVHVTDLIFIGGITLPLFILVLVFHYSGRRPSDRHFTGDPIHCEEGSVYYTRVQKFRRQSSTCYLVLTATRLMVFVFTRKIVEIRLDKKNPPFRIEGKKIVIQREKDKIILRPPDITRWKDCLSSYLH